MIESKSEWNEEKAERYVRWEYTRCPICKSGDINGDQVEIDGNVAWQRVSCVDCGAVWEDVYTLTGVNIVSFGYGDSEVSLGGN